MKNEIELQPSTHSRKMAYAKRRVGFREKNGFRCILLAGLFAAAAPAWAAQKAWTGAAADTFWSTAANWSPAGFPRSGDNVTFANQGFTDTPLSLGGVVNTVVDAGFSSSINSLGFRNIIGVHNLSLATPLIVKSTSASDVAFMADDGQAAVVFVGSGQADAAGDIVYASIIGDSLSVSNVNASLSVMQASVTSGSHRATLDLTGLNFFTCVVSNVLVGHDFGVPITRPTGTLILALSNSITSRLISVADAYQNAGAISYLHLGQGNTLNVDRIRLALHKCVATVDFATGLITPSVTFRSAAGGGRQVSWEIGDEYEPDTTIGYFTSSQSTGIMDLSGGRVDALVDRIILGRGQTNAPTRTGDGNGTLTFGGGSINANSLEMGIQLSDGGSAGRGILNVNNDDGVGPATLTVNGNLVMAVQRPGNTDLTGSTAEINLNGGALAVAGHVMDGGGLSTININGGALNLMPAGDTTPGDVSVDILNLNDGILTNYATLSVSNITLAGSVTQFTVHPGQTIAPIAVGTIGTLKVSGDLKLRGTTDMDIAKAGNTRTADKIVVSGSLDFGGELRVRLSGTSPFAAGDKFVLFGAGTTANSFTTITLPPPGAGLAWANKILMDGSIEIVASSEPTTPPTLAVNKSGASINLSWPAAYTSFALRGQTNPITIGLSTNWGRVTGVVGNQVTIPLNSANGTVFFQLFQQ